MLSRILKDRIQKRYGSKIKFPKDCFGLAAHIKSECNCVISPSTLKRAFGFTTGTEYLRPATKDAIANYLGMDDWNKLQDDLLGKKISRKPVIELLQPSSLKQGQIVLVMFGRISFLKLKYDGNDRFTAVDQWKTNIDHGDEVQIEEIKLDYPLLIVVKKKGARYRDVILGELTGVTEIEVLRPVKEKNRILNNGSLNHNK